MPRALLPAVAVATLAVAVPADAAISILRGDGTPADPAEATVTFKAQSGSYDVTLTALYAPGGETVYRIRGNGGEVIDNVWIDVPCWEGSDGRCAPAGSPVMVHVLSDPPFGITSVNNVEQTGTAETFVLNVYAEQDIGSVTAEDIGVVLAGRDIIGPITATTEDNTVRGVFWVEAHRDLLGDVSAENGRIGRVWAWGDIGTPSEPVTITAKHKLNDIFCGDGWCWLSWLDMTGGGCAGDMYATVNTRANGGAGGIRRFFAGRFSGALDTEAIIYDTATGTPGSMVITRVFDGTVSIGGSYVDPALLIELPAAGFSGQVIVNADANAGGTWTGPVRLGPANSPMLVLNDSGYSTKASELGGGSVGLVPFALHDESSVPANGGLVTPEAGDDPLTVRLRHYGPVALAGPVPVTVQARLLGSLGPLTPVASALFTYEIDPSDPNTLLIGSPGVGGGFQPGFEYLLQVTPDLVSNVPSATPVQWDQDYYFGFETVPCDGDVDGSGDVNVVDLLGLLQYWGPVTAQSASADFDDSGLIDVADLLTVLANWGTCS